MQLYVVNWSFQDLEDQIFATNEFCKYFKEGMMSQSIEGFELKFIAHMPQNGSGIIICEAQNTYLIFKVLKMWRENFSISFNIKPALTNEGLYSSHNEKSFWIEE